MKTIRRNSTRIIAEIKKSIVSVVFYDQNGGGLKPTTLDAAMDDLYRFDFSKLHDQGDGKYTVHVHSNLWYHLYTQAHLDAARAEQAQREARYAQERQQRPAIATPTREQRNAATIARTTSIHDLGKPATVPVHRLHVMDRRDGVLYVFQGIGGPSVWLSDPADPTNHSQWVTIGEFRTYFEAVCENRNNHQNSTCPGCGTEDEDGNQVDEPAITVTATRTRMAIGTQIAEACETLEIELGYGYAKGAQTYVVQGCDYTAGELADLVLVGGFAGNYNGNEVRVNWDSPLAPRNATQERRAGRALVITREMQARFGTSTARELEEIAQPLMDMLHGWAIEDAPRVKVDYPSGAAEPDFDVTAVRCVRTGEVWRRDAGRWVTGEGDAARWCIWYRLNETDPMSEGFNIYREES